MLSFKEARDFMQKKSPLEIFQRVVLYEVWAEEWFDKCIDSDILLVTVAMFGGEFDEKVFEDREIKRLLTITNWGERSNTNQLVTQWMSSVVKTPSDVQYGTEIIGLVKQKIDDIYYHLQKNAKNGYMFNHYFGFGSQWPII